MSKRVHFSCFEAPAGGYAHYVTTKQFNLLTGMRATDGFYDGNDMVLFCYPRHMRLKDAKAAAKEAYDEWLKAGRPNVSKQRQRVIDLVRSQKLTP